MGDGDDWTDEEIARLLAALDGPNRRLMERMARRRRKPPEAGIAVPAVPPRGPLPRQGGAEAPLTFD